MPNYGNIDPALEGGLFQTDDAVDSLLAADAAGIGFGKPAFVLKGDTTKVYNAAGANRTLLGVTIRSAKEAAGYAQTETVGILREGKVWVTAGAAVQANEPVFIDATTFAWTNVSTSNIVTPYVFRSNAASGALVVLDALK